MGDLIRGFFADPFGPISGPAIPAVPVWVPPVDIEETDDSYLLEIDLPGVRPEDVNLELRDSNELRISGQYRERERSGTLRRQDRRTGEFEYDVILPGDVDPEQVEASLQDGVLSVRLGKARNQPRRIEVHGGTAGGEFGGQGTREAASGSTSGTSGSTSGTSGTATRTPPQAGSVAEATTGGVSSAEATPRRDASSVGDRQGSAQGSPQGSPATGGPRGSAGGRGSK
jgi:HSP20 family protein